MIAFGWVTNLLQRGHGVVEADARGARRGAGDRRRAASTDAGRALELAGAIEFRDLTFAYPATRSPVLHDVSLRIEPGQTAAIVGATGSGKSTLLNLLPRLHEPPPGTVFIDGVDVREIPLARAARRDRLRAAGAVPVLRHDRREHRVRRARRTSTPDVRG